MTEGRWHNDVLRDLRGDAPPAAESTADPKPPLPVRDVNEQRPNPGSYTDGQEARPDRLISRRTEQTPHPAPATTPQLSDPADLSLAPRPSRQTQLPLAVPNSVAPVDPRLALALGKGQHGDSAVRRTGRSLRRLASSASQDVAEESRLARELQQPVTTGRVIAVTSIRGGVGKTTTAALLARTLTHYRHDPVLALDADAALGTLAVRMGAESVRWTCAEVARILTPSMQLTDITGYLVPTAGGGWLLPASRGQIGAPLDIRTYRTLVLALRRHFAVTVADCETLPGEVARGALDTAHARLVVAPLTAEGVGSTRVVLDWLGRLPHAALASTVVALTASAPDQSLNLKTATAHLRETGVTVVHLPYDRHLATGGPIRADLLGEATRRAAARLSAEVMNKAVRTR
ncbi:AAA family ATPase [Streptomyces sp. NPDC058297]|uniref:nucleotide-binding protein n=1 Tax=Streptomyces sp. NPDC058297 TaxID=3346433 RepID=UPI0036EA9852